MQELDARFMDRAKSNRGQTKVGKLRIEMHESLDWNWKQHFGIDNEHGECEREIYVKF